MTAKSGSVVGGASRPGPRTGGAGGGRRQRWAALALLAAAASQPGCGKTTTISVRVVTPSGAADPFLNAATVRLTQGTSQITTPVTAGKFQVKLDLDAPPTDQFMQILVEALDSSAMVVARGVTPNFDPQNTDVAVYVNRPGQVGSTDLHLPDDMVATGSVRGRRDLMAAALIGRQVMPAEPGIGALIVGGAADDGSLVSEAVMYQTLGHQIIDAGSPTSAGTPSTARRGGVLLTSADATTGQQAVLWGGAGPGGTLPTHADKFDPAVSTLSMVWAHPVDPFFDAKGPGAYAPAVGLVGSVFLVCGGSSTVPTSSMPDDTPLSQAVLVRRNAAAAASADQSALLGVTRVPPSVDMTGHMIGPMIASRYQHTVTATADAGSGFVFGGLSAADSKANKPAAETFALATNIFTEFLFKPPASAPLSRRGHIAARLTNGRILIAGGYTYDMAGTKTVEGSALIIDPDPAGASVQTIPQAQFLKTPRYAATVTAIGGELVICGGFDATNTALADCEIFAADTGMPARSTIKMPGARAGHVAVPLENGLTLLLGGVDEKNAALSTIDIYSPFR